MIVNEQDILKLVYRAKLAEQAERYSEMKTIMRDVGMLQKNLNEEERSLLAIGYKNHTAQLRTGWRCAEAACLKYKEKDAVKEQYAAEYAKELATQILDICTEVDQLVRTLKEEAIAADDVFAEAFYSKMEADYRRYRAEIDSSEIQIAAEAYSRAISVADRLPNNHATRLGVALNYSVFKYELEKDFKNAIETAQRALTECEYEPQNNRDANMAYQLLKDNLDLWSAENAAPEPVTTI